MVNENSNLLKTALIEEIISSLEKTDFIDLNTYFPFNNNYIICIHKNIYRKNEYTIDVSGDIVENINVNPFISLRKYFNTEELIKLLNSFSLLQLQYIKINLHEKTIS